MTFDYDKYELICGLEIHIQLSSKSKAFSNDAAEYGALPNTNISTISLGHPGTLPVLNEKSVEYAIKLGLATNCHINELNHFARKNYFYADLPKGYQITQFNTPICTNGNVTIKLEEGEKTIGITRIHIEEDSGKSIHDLDPYNSLVDLNRAGVPLLEMVSEPDMRSSEDAYQYLNQIRKLVRYLDICDGNLEEGSMRCDANVSVRLKGASEFGQKVEVKNMNSIRNVKRAIDFEFKRQVEAVETKEAILQETRSFNAETGETFAMRSKEDAHDYRYFNEPDLPPLFISEEDIKEVRVAMPALPEALFQKYVTTYGLSDYDAGVLTEEKGVALYFDELTTHTKHYKTAANWVSVAIKSYLNEHAVEIDEFPISAAQMASLIELIESGKISHSMASQKLFPAFLAAPTENPLALAEKLNLIQDSDEEAIRAIIQQALASNPAKVEEYKSGKKGLIGMFMGQVMKLSGGKVDPKLANKLLQEALK